MSVMCREKVRSTEIIMRALLRRTFQNPSDSWASAAPLTNAHRGTSRIINYARQPPELSKFTYLLPPGLFVQGDALQQLRFTPTGCGTSYALTYIDACLWITNTPPLLESFQWDMAEMEMTSAIGA